MTSLLLLALACIPEQAAPALDDTPAEVPLPDSADVDFEAAFTALLQTAVVVDLRPAWQAHLDTLELATPGCPDFYVGVPEVDDDALDEDALGMAWSDRCRSGEDLWSGYAFWQNDLAVSGSDAEGWTSDGSRALVADAVMSRGDSLLNEFKGSGQDALFLVQDGDYSRWVYSSSLDATVTGDLPFGGGALQGGYRTDLYLEATGGDSDLLTLRGDVYFFDALIENRFDSFSLDIELQGELGADPEACTLEPRGRISLRDQNAYWYDLVFQPRDEDGEYDNEPYAECDGCGTLYIRGQEQAEPVCLDFGFLFQGTLAPPEPADFVFSLRDL